jgi:NitT/TauT family transport system permease protein
MMQRRRFVEGRLGAVVLPILGMVVLVAIWWLAVLAFHIQYFLLPTPLQVAQVFVHAPGEMLGHLRASAFETLEGYGLAVVAGLAIALAVAGSRTIDRMFTPLLVAANAVPKVALAPLVVIWLGLGQVSRVALVFLVCFFPIVVSAVAGFTATPAELAELGRSLSASPRQMFLKVRVPGALPHIFVGLKVAVGLAVIGATVAELSGATEGLMYAVQAYGGQGQTAPAIAALVLLAVLSIVLYYLLVALERRLLPWARETAG